MKRREKKVSRNMKWRRHRNVIEKPRKFCIWYRKVGFGMGDRHEQFRQLKKDLADINTQRGGGPNGVKGFYAEHINSTYGNLERIDKRIAARENVIDDNGDWDAIVRYATGASGRQIQDKVGYTFSYYKNKISTNQYDGGILRINPDNPIFSNEKKLNELKGLAKEHRIKIVKGSVTEKEVKTLAVVAGVEGKVSSALGMEKKAPLTAELYVDFKEIAYALETVRDKAIRDGNVASQDINKQRKEIAINNIAKTGHEAGKYGAENSGITALTISGIMNVVSVIKGEKKAGEAVGDIVKDSGKATMSGYGMGAGLTVVSHSLCNSSSKFIQGLVKSNVPGKVITAVMNTGDTLKKWGEGKITTEECLIELGDKGLNMVTMGYSMAVGQTLIPIPIVGGAVGALVGSMLTSSLYNHLINMLQTKQLEHEERMRIIEECHLVAQQAKTFRIELETYLDSYFREYRECFETALSSMQLSYQMGDADGIIAGANDITRKLGGQVYYETVEEFKSFIDDDSIDIL